MSVAGITDQQQDKGEADNAVVTITIAQRIGHSIVLDWVLSGFNDRTISQIMRIEQPLSTVKQKYPVHGADGFSLPIVFQPGNDVSLVLPASGVAGKVGFLGCGWHYIT